MAAGWNFHVEPRHRAALEVLGLDTLDGCLAFRGGEAVKAKVTGREVRSVSGTGSGPRYFLKRVQGPGWRDVLREASVLDRLRRQGQPVAEPAAVGATRGGAALITVALPASTSLERLFVDGPPDPERALTLASRVGETLRDLHGAGVNHRDFYAGHVLVDATDRIWLVDFGRAEVRRRVPWRRVVKDVAALLFSLPGRVFPEALREEFLRSYLGEDVGRKLDRLRRAAGRRSATMLRHAERQLARGARNLHVNR